MKKKKIITQDNAQLSRFPLWHIKYTTETILFIELTAVYQDIVHHRLFRCITMYDYLCQYDMIIGVLRYLDPDIPLRESEVFVLFSMIRKIIAHDKTELAKSFSISINNKGSSVVIIPDAILQCWLQSIYVYTS